MHDSTGNLDETLADDEAQEWPDEQEEPRGAGIGRYIVVDKLGAGAMGVVYAAYDPELDRKVAVKLVHASARDPETGHARLLREAQALARVSDPNVVTVHDVGSHDGKVFVAMEFVQGVTLTRWMATPRPWQVMLHAMVRAGRGLAAVHAAGLVHRDFKPDNVMIGDDGRVRVMDFGLARVGAAGDGPRTAGDIEVITATGTGDTQVCDEPAARSGPSGSAPELRLTRTGALLGTPAYMAPELYHGRGADPRSDQFGLCVAIYEALYGQHPFAATTLTGLVVAAMGGKVRAPPAGSRVPAAVHRAVLRGLAPRPEDRWPDVATLLVALDQGPGRGRLRALMAGGLALGLAAAVYVGTVAGADACSGGERQIAEVWDETRRVAVARAFTATGLPYAGAVWTQVARDFDEHAQVWAAMHRDACEAHRRGEQSHELLDLRMTCLEGQRQELAALVEVLAAADATTVEHAAQASEQLADAGRCADLGALRTRVAPPADPAALADVERLRTRLALARAEQRTGRYEAGRQIARAVQVAATATGYRPLLAEAALLAGGLSHEIGDHPDARTRMTNAYFEALAVGHESVAVDAAIGLVHSVGDRQHELGEAEVWARSAGALLEHASADDRRWLDLANARGVLYHDAGRLDDAEREYRGVLVRATRDHSDAPMISAMAHNNLGILLRSRGDFARADVELRAALVIYVEKLGPTHPRLIETLTNLGATAIAAGDLEQGQTIAVRAQEIAEQAYPGDSPRIAPTLTMRANLEMMRGQAHLAVPLYQRALGLLEVGEHHPDRAVLHNNLGSALQQLRRFPEAVTHFERAIEIRQRALGPEHAEVASVLANLGGLLGDMGQGPRAVATLRRALTLQERLLGRDHPDLGYTLSNLGMSERDAGQLGDAERDLRRAVAIWERSVGPEHAMLMYPRAALGRVALDRGKPQQAVPWLEAARTGTVSTDPVELAELDFLLARALWEGDGDRGRAIALARAAAPVLRASDDLAAEAAAWLKVHDRKASRD